MAKIYTKNTWVDESLTEDARYKITPDDGTPVAGGVSTLSQAITALNELLAALENGAQINLLTPVAQAGTALTAARMNNIEDGIDAIDTLLRAVATEKTVSGGVLTVDQSRHKIQPETGTADDIDTITGMETDTTMVLIASDNGTDTLTFKHGTGNISCAGGADIDLSEGAIICYYDGTTVYISGGGGGNIIESISPTTANITAVVNHRYFADISGLTASRNFIIPTGTVGDEIELTLTVGDADYELIIIGAATVTINGGAAATEWSRLFISGETIKLVATSGTNWQVIEDGRIPSKCRIKNTDKQTITTGSPTVVDLDEVEFDVGALNNTANDRIIIRRTGYYNLFAILQYEPITADRVIATIEKNATGIARVEMTAAVTYPAMAPNTIAYLADGDIITLTTYHNASGNFDTVVVPVPPYLAVSEVLP